MLVIQCKVCGEDVECYPCDVKSGRKKYCSRRCRGMNAFKTHGLSRTRLHNIWCGMKGRCESYRKHLFTYYRGRGITVCAEWMDFDPFKEWALANGYRDDLELDRKENDKGYSPENCRWATREQQMSNTRKKRDGRTSRFKGVSWCANVKKWRTQIQHDKKHRHVGLFENEADAARAYDTEARRLFGEFASLNFKE